MSGPEATVLVLLGSILGFVLGLFGGAVLIHWYRGLDRRMRYDDDVRRILARQREGR